MRSLLAHGLRSLLAHGLASSTGCSRWEANGFSACRNPQHWWLQRSSGDNGFTMRAKRCRLLSSHLRAGKFSESPWRKLRLEQKTQEQGRDRPKPPGAIQPGRLPRKRPFPEEKGQAPKRDTVLRVLRATGYFGPYDGPHPTPPLHP